MQRILGSIFLLGLLSGAWLLPACSGGGGGGSSGNQAAVFRISGCSLGCSAGTCAANSTAVNQDIVITFNDRVDPATVSFTTIPIVETGTGSTPPGAFIVQGRTVIFRPALLLTDTGITFGFEEGGEYEIRLFASPDSNVVRSTIGRPNTTPLRCIVTASGVVDLVPGRPTVSFTPNAADPPAGREFVITMVFNDLMQVGQLVDPETGTSPTLRAVVVDESVSPALETTVDGVYEAVLDRNSLTTTVTFTAFSPYPGNHDGQRYLRLDFAGQIGDLVGNTLANAGSYVIPLPAAPTTEGSFVESFDDLSQLDSPASTAGLWAAPPGALDSGLNPVTGRHRGGGSGILGRFEPAGDFSFSTDSMTLGADEFDTLTGQDVTVTKGVFLFDSIRIPAGVVVRASGNWPLRLYARGEIVIEGTLDVTGESAPENFGKYFPTNAENIDGEDQGGISVAEASGGIEGRGGPGGGSGGHGGASWYLLTDPPKDYYDESKNNFQSGSPDPTRFVNRLDPFDNVSGFRAYGGNGDGVANRNSTGDAWARAADIATDRRNGAGMGSWSWPLRSNSVPYPAFTNDVRILSHFDPLPGRYLSFSLHRARGGGGGGFWSDGEQGWVFDPNGTDPLGNPLLEPTIDSTAQVFEYNSLYTWDTRVSGTVPDGAGGDFDVSLKPGIETLEPSTTATSNLLIGGSGGGAAGMSQHGSWNAAPSATRGTLDTYRTCDGGGGGGGGGGLQLHGGGRFAVSGLVSANGGGGGSSTFMLDVPYSPPNAVTLGPPGDAGGGGGSGGSILVEVNDGLEEVGADVISVEGGAGGLGSAGNHGGSGGSGLVRFETLTGSEGLPELAALVAPDGAVDLAPVGQPGVPNRTAQAAQILDGDITLNGDTINSNASGVRSLWFLAPEDLLQLFIAGWTVTCEYSTGGAPQTLVFDQDQPPQPGLPDTQDPNPIWIGFQTGWGPPGATEPDPLTVGGWVVPSRNPAGIGGGLAQIQANLWRMLRFQVVFDQDLVAALIGTHPNAYFRVTEVRIDWSGD
ncbi:MAG: hypothetical protein EYC70_14460 [Planctomycetota bacterium]|nr:MAG: hypothetical protein EYC70_14460 [Planctomycetota bacterium]